VGARLPTEANRRDAGLALTGDFYPNGHLGDYSVVIPAQTVAVALPGLLA